MSLKLHTQPHNFEAFKILIAAAYNGVHIEVPAFNAADKDFIHKSPLGKTPVLERENGSTLFEVNAAARYVARLKGDTKLLGTCLFQSAQVDQWMDFATHDIDPVRAVWLFSVWGVIQADHQALEAAKHDVSKALNVLEHHLQTNTYLVGHRVSLADVCVACSLWDLTAEVFDPEFRAKFVNVFRWYTTIVNQPEFVKVAGKPKFADKEAKPAGGAAAGKKAKEEKKEKPKEDKPKEAPAKKAEKPAEKPAPAAAEGEDGQEKKKPNPLDLLPKSPMIFDVVKKSFFDSKKDIAGWFKQFWPTFDHAGYCVYTCNFKDNATNTVYFMTCNLLNGFLQRIDDARKYAFGSMILSGKGTEDEDIPPYNVSGCFIFRGLEIPAEVRESGSFESYDWAKVDVTSEAGQKVLENFFIGNQVSGLNVLERKYFK